MGLIKKFANIKLISLKKLLLCFILTAGFSMSVFAEDNVTTITITNARTTTYTKDKENDNDLIILEGSVELSVSKGSTTTEINADKITYNRQTEMLFAEGNVEILTKGSSAGGETTTAKSLLMNTGTLEGIFDGGKVVQTQSDAINLPSGSTLVVFSDIFGKSENNTIAFKNSSLTFCDDENPHWHIDATRTWLLPGGEFAFFNALLYVGPVPVLYLPAFYYPKDELVFNPVFGNRKREGYYVQTTTYLYGRKPLNSSSSSSTSDENTTASAESLKALYNFMKPTVLKEQKLEGLILHNLDEDYKGDTSSYLKVLADWYSNLGGLVGVDGVFRPNDYITNISFNINTGFSNTIFYDKGVYLPYSSIYKKYWDKSNFLGLKMPFRYGGNVDFTLSKPFKFTLNLPLYSDPFFAYDFKEREESMDWISYFMSKSSTTKEEENSATEVSSYTWKMSASYNPDLPAVLKPYISSVSTSLNSSILISSINNTNISEDERAKNNDNWKSYSPERKFYYPSQVTPGNVTLTFSGTLFQWPLSSSSNGYKTTPSYVVPLTKPEEIMTPKELEEYKKAQKEKAAEAENGADEQKELAVEENKEDKTEEFVFVNPVLPDLSVSATSTSVPDGLAYKLTYSVAPVLNTQFAYASTDSTGTVYLKESKDFKWSKVKSYMYTFKSPVSLTSDLNYGGNFFSLNNKFSYDPFFQDHPNTDGYSDSQRKSLIYSDYNARTQTVSNTNVVSIKPFAYLPNFAETGVSWNTSMKIFRRKFIGDTNDTDWENTWDSAWENQWVDWEDADSFTNHTLDVTLASNELSNRFKQSLVFTSTLKPQVPKYSATLELVFPYVTGKVSYSFQQKSKDDQTWVKNPLQQSLNISLFDSALKINESFNYNFEDDHWDSLKTSVIWKSLSASYVMSYTNGYDFDEENGWKVQKEKSFLPYSFTFSYSPSTKTYYAWFNRVSVAPGVSTSITADLIRPTNSYFTITPSLSFKINDFFTLSFSSTSKNAVLYRYFQKSLGHDGRIPGEQNIFVDLWNSFRFDNEDLRKGSGFKLKNLKLDMAHELHDWSFKMSFKFEPRLVTEDGIKHYDYNPYITIGIVWKPMESMKASVVDEYGTWKFE